MMKKITIIALLFISAVSNAQESKGIKFVHGLTWSQIKEKAKNENKYIFLDAFTTWCVPCKVMVNEIFPQPKVSTFFNDNFINVSVQIDITKKDNKEIRAWYKDAKIIEKTYAIKAYPTFLFFDPQGELVDNIVGGSSNAEDFIEKSKAALNPATQYSLLKQQYYVGKRSDEFLLKLINTAQQSGDYSFLPVVVNKYLSKQKNLLSTQNLNFIVSSTSKSTDPGFNILKKYSIKIDSIAGKGISERIINTIAFDEVVLPLVRNAGVKVNNGQMFYYTGEINKNVNWLDVKMKLEEKYSDMSDEILMYAKPLYFQWLKDWPQFSGSVLQYISKYADIVNNDALNNYAYTIFNFCDDKKCLEDALIWSNKALLNGNEKNIVYLDTYANLLYKSGKKEQALSVLQKALNSTGGRNEYLTSIIKKMENNEKTWIN